MALAILDSSEIAHPALEAVFTVDEEIGMEGAQGLDFSQLSARRMLNIDSEDGDLYRQLRRRRGANVSVGLTMAPNAAPCAKLTVSGLIGGHSGQEINKGRANANILLGRVLDALVQMLPVRLVSAAGGRKDNAIPNAAGGRPRPRRGRPARRKADRICLHGGSPQRNMPWPTPASPSRWKKAAVCPQALTEEATLRVVRYLLLVPNGIAAMSMDIPGLVQTSCNLGIFHVADGVLTAVSSVRSSVASQKQMLLARFAALSQLLGGSLQVTGAYPAWEYRRESVLGRRWLPSTSSRPAGPRRSRPSTQGWNAACLPGSCRGWTASPFGPDLVDIHTARRRCPSPRCSARGSSCSAYWKR